MTSLRSGPAGQVLPSPSLGPPKLSPSPSPPPFCGMTLEPDPLLDPEPEPEPLDPEPEPLDPELDPEPDPDMLLESLSDLWCLWCLWCIGSAVGDGLLAGSLCVGKSVRSATTLSGASRLFPCAPRTMFLAI